MLIYIVFKSFYNTQYIITLFYKLKLNLGLFCGSLWVINHLQEQMFFVLLFVFVFFYMFGQYLENLFFSNLLPCNSTLLLLQFLLSLAWSGAKLEKSFLLQVRLPLKSLSIEACPFSYSLSVGRKSNL